MSSSRRSRLRVALATALFFVLVGFVIWRVKPISLFRNLPESSATQVPSRDLTIAENSPDSANDHSVNAAPDASPQPSPPPSAPVPVANEPDGNPGPSTREEAANGQSIAAILRDADMTDPDVRARKQAEIALLQERQQKAVEAKANLLGIPLRVEGPDHKISILYDIRGNIPLYRTTLNTNAAISTGANLLAPAPYSLDGTGIKVGIWDGGPVRATHQELSGRVTRKDVASSVAADDHATHVSGTIGATGVQPAAKGMAPKVNIDSYEWTNDYAEMTAAGAASATDTARLPLSNHSYGYDAATADMGRYETEASNVDAVAASLPYYLVFWAAGNEQDTLTAKGGYQSITFNGLGKNIMTIGAVNDAVTAGIRAPSAGTIAFFSSLGPCDDGRIKPDLVANGVNLYSSVATSNTAYDGTYSGTSMATPNALGSATLLVQLYAREFSGKRMRASTLKALMVQTADDIGTAGPDYKYGWGLINVKAAGDFMLAHKASLASPKMIEADISNTTTTQTHTFTWDGVTPIRASLCWTDPAGVAQTGTDSRTPNLINNLDAKITAPDGTTTYQPFVMPFVGTWTQASMALAAVRGKNNADNVEQVYIPAPSQQGVYTVTVSVDGRVTGSTQAYSLMISGGTNVETNPPPSIALTSPAGGAAYLPETPVTVSATATDLALGGAPGSVAQVEFFSGNTSIGVDSTAPYSITWTPPASGTFVITAQATDNENAAATSAGATINVLVGNGSPAVTSFTPTSSTAGSLVILTGVNFVNVTSVQFNGVNAEFTVDSTGQITAKVPNLATTGTITVTNSYGTGTSTTPFTVVQSPVLISQIYGAGGNTGATYKQDYIELYNRSDATVSLSGWSVQYSSASGTTWQATALTGSIAPGKYYLVGLASGTSGAAIPTPNATGTLGMSATTGKVALRNITTALSGSSPIGQAGLQDFVGFGTANAFETAVAPAPSTTTAIFRAGSGATDTGNNSADFTASTPNPRNAGSSASAPVISSTLTATGTAGTPFTYQIAATNTPTSFAASGLPSGLTVNTATGAITGTPTAAATSSISISATNSIGTGSATLVLTVSTAPTVSVSLLSENMGTTASTTKTIAENVFQNSGLTFTGTGDVRVTEPSSGYTGASGSSNVFITNTVDKSFEISGISTTGYSNLNLKFGQHKNTKDGSNELVVEVSPDGTTYTPLTYTRPMGSGTATWALISPVGTIPQASNLRIRFRQTSISPQFRVDDVVLTGTAIVASPSITTTGTLTAISSTYGRASSTAASFTLSGANMSAGILITPPAGFEVSLAQAAGYSATLTIGAAGTIPATPVYLRLAATNTAGSYSGDIVCSSIGAPPATLAMPVSPVATKLLTITANDRSKAVGETLNLGPNQSAFTSSGLVGAETIGSVTLSSAGAASPAGIGTYPLTPSAATGGTFAASNYDFNYVDGALTVYADSAYDQWIASFSNGSSLTGANDDMDGDGIPNAIENILGTPPNAPSNGMTQISGSPTALVFRHTRSNLPAADITASYEWSTDLTNWHTSGISEGDKSVSITTNTVIDLEAPANDTVQVTASVSGGLMTKLYLRLKATKP